MKAKYSFEFMNLDDEMVAVPIGDYAEQFHGVIKLNETAFAILKLLEKDMTENEIVEALLLEYSGEKAQIVDYVHGFLKKMVLEGVVE